MDSPEQSSRVIYLEKTMRENSWLTVVLGSPLDPPLPVGNLSHTPPVPDPPDPPDPLLFPPLPSPLPFGQKPSKRLSLPSTSPKIIVPSQISASETIAAVSRVGESSLQPSTTAQLLATYTSLPPCNFSNPKSPSATVAPVTTVSSHPLPLTSSVTAPMGSGLLPPPCLPPTPVPPTPIIPTASPSPPSSSNPPPKASYATKTRVTINRALSRLSPQNFSPEGIPRVVIPDEVYKKGAELHKDFLVCRFFGRAPAYSLIQNVLNYLWGKGRHLEIHMLPQSNSALVRLPNDFIREKVLEKRYWYVDTCMFYVSKRSDHPQNFTPSLQRIQLWAHLKGVPFDLIYDAGLSHIAGQIGEPKETDDWTLNLSSISVAHVKIEIDTTIPLPSKIEVGRTDGSFVTVDVEYPWIPPSCAHCKEVGHIQRHCLQPPPPSDPKQKPPPPSHPKPSSSHPPKKATPKKPTPPQHSTPSTKPLPANKFCFSCRGYGHLMNNCPKGPEDWTLVNGKKTYAKNPDSNPIPQTASSPLAPDPPPTDHVHDHVTDPCPVSMEIDRPIQPSTPSDSAPLVPSSQPVSVLALPATFTDRPILVPSAPFPSKPLSTNLSINPFSPLLSSQTPDHDPENPSSPLLASPNLVNSPFISVPESSSSEEAQTQA